MTGTSSTELHPLSPHLVCAGASEAIDFYRRAFGAEELIRVPGPDGKLIHACVSINGSSVMLVDENVEMGNVSPLALKGTPVTIHLQVEDVDKATERATLAGAKVVMPVEDMFWGDRFGVIEDPFGHRWSLATPKRQMSAEEIQAAARTEFGGCGPGDRASKLPSVPSRDDGNEGKTR